METYFWIDFDMLLINYNRRIWISKISKRKINQNKIKRKEKKSSTNILINALARYTIIEQDRKVQACQGFVAKIHKLYKGPSDFRLARKDLLQHTNCKYQEERWRDCDINAYIYIYNPTKWSMAAIAIGEERDRQPRYI